MAMQDVTEDVNRLIESGWDIDDLSAEVRTRSGYVGRMINATDDGRFLMAPLLAKHLDTIPAAEPKTIPSEPMATDRQIDYAVSLLIKKHRSGEGDGFIDARGLITGGTVDKGALRAMTRRQISSLIDSLKGDY